MHPQGYGLPLREEDEALLRRLNALRAQVAAPLEGLRRNPDHTGRGQAAALYAFLDKLPGVLKPGGRAAVLTFHSGEDRLVKQAFRRQLREGLYRDIAGEVTRPSPQECRQNPRAHSTKLRWAVRM